MSHSEPSQAEAPSCCFESKAKCTNKVKRLISLLCPLHRLWKPFHERCWAPRVSSKSRTVWWRQREGGNCSSWCQRIWILIRGSEYQMYNPGQTPVSPWASVSSSVNWGGRGWIRSLPAFFEALTFEMLRTKFQIPPPIHMGQRQSAYFQYSLIIAKLSLVFPVTSYTVCSSWEAQAGRPSIRVLMGRVWHWTSLGTSTSSNTNWKNNISSLGV